MLFNSNNSFVWIKKSLPNKLFSFIQSNLFSQCRRLTKRIFLWNLGDGPSRTKNSNKGFSNRDITILSMNKTQKYLRYWVQIYCGCSASIIFYEWNSISVVWPPWARLQRSILWTQFSTTLAHILTGTLAISRWMLSLRSSKVASLLT